MSSYFKAILAFIICVLTIPVFGTNGVLPDININGEHNRNFSWTSLCSTHKRFVVAWVFRVSPFFGEFQLSGLIILLCKTDL